MVANHTIPMGKEKQNMVDSLGSFLASASKPLNPYVVWEMNPVKCPINSYEFYFMTMVVTLFLYCTVSMLTNIGKEKFNLDRMLHRGKYNLDKHNQAKSAWSWKTVFGKLIGITPEYSFWDQVVAYSIFGYSIIYRFLGTFLVIVIWNLFQKWPQSWWSGYFLVTSMLVPGAIAVIVTFWFGIGAVVDMRALFRDLKNRKINFLDNGQVEGTMSLADKAELEALDAGDKKDEKDEAKA